jgi:hypothetical protein
MLCDVEESSKGATFKSFIERSVEYKTTDPETFAAYKTLD